MPSWLRAIVPDWLEHAVVAFGHPKMLLGATIASAVLFVLGIVATPWVVARLPRDYFKRRPNLVSHVITNPSLRVVAHILKNIIGVILLLAGIMMLVTPGPGVLSILMALVMLDFPGKRGLERKLVCRPRVLRTMNKLRRKMGKEPLVV